MMKPVLTVMVGLPASGKTTVAHNIAKETESTVFSSDEYRKKLLGDENCQDNNSAIFDSLYKDIRVCLSSGRNAIFDACNISYKDRKRLFNEIADINCRVNCVVVLTPFEECVRRDLSRIRTVGSAVIHKFLTRFNFPQKWEGFLTYM